jgi:hypothetical protein
MTKWTLGAVLGVMWAWDPWAATVATLVGWVVVFHITNTERGHV